MNDGKAEYSTDDKAERGTYSGHASENGMSELCRYSQIGRKV